MLFFVFTIFIYDIKFLSSKSLSLLELTAINSLDCKPDLIKY